MNTDSFLKYLEMIDDDTSFIRFLVTMETVVSSWDNYRKSISCLNCVDAQIDDLDNSFGSILQSILESYVDDDDIIYEVRDSFEEDEYDILDAFDYSDQIIDYISSRINDMNISDIVYFIAGMSAFSRGFFDDPWYCFANIEEKIYNSILQMSLTNFIFVISNCFSAFMNNEYYTEAIVSRIDNMTDLEFIVFRRFIMHDDFLLVDDEIAFSIRNKIENLKSPILFFNKFSITECADYSEYIFPSEKEKSIYNFSSLIDCGSYDFEARMDFIDDNFILLLYILFKPSIILKCYTKYNGLPRPCVNVNISLIRKFADRISSFSVQEIKFLYAFVSCFEGACFNECIKASINARIDELGDICNFDERDLHIVKNLKEFADNICYTTFVYDEFIDASLGDDLFFNKDKLDSRMDEIENIKSSIFDDINCIEFMDTLDLIKLLRITKNKKINDNDLLLEYIIFRILTENNKIYIGALLILEVEGLEKSIRDAIDLKLYMERFIEFVSEESHDKTLLI